MAKRKKGSSASSGTAQFLTSAGAIEHLLQHRPERIRSLTFEGHKLGKRLETIKTMADEHGISYQVNEASRNREVTPVKAWITPFEYSELETVIEAVSDKKNSIVLCLDHLKDPQNLGAIARTADGLGVDAIVIPKDRSVTVSEGSYNASVGAIETVPVCRVVNLSSAMKQLKDAGYWLVGASTDAGSDSLWKVPDFEKVALVMGSEFDGLSPSLANQCDVRTHIPIEGSVGSFNVSVSAAILIYETMRKWQS